MAMGDAADFAVVGARIVPRAARPPAEPRRVPLRAIGLLAMLCVVILAVLLAVSALLFRSVVEGDLEALEKAQVEQAHLMKRWLGESTDGTTAIRELELRLRLAAANSAQHLADARHHLDAGTVTIACLGWLGITTMGALSLLFFSRMAVDIGTLRGRALAIVAGERSRGEALSRNDELSDLAQEVDNLADALARRERELEIERRHVMHQEKLATIGAMAAGVLREIGNPIAAIDGYALAMHESRARGDCGPPAQSAVCDPGPILRETARLAAITHEISELAVAPAAQWQLASLNDIVMQTIGLLRYEPRLELVRVVTQLDRQLPAVMAIADRLVHSLINLVINAADAMVTLPSRAGRIEIATHFAPGGVELSVTDNGCGMTEAVRERAFEMFFTTKPPGIGTGLGLPLCRAIAQDHGGRIDIDSTPGQGTRVSVWLPIDAIGAPLH